MNPDRSDRVSFDDEPLIVVDDDDRVLDYRPKVDVHEGEGVLHRAFSVFLFNSQGQVLMQQRSAEKPLWPLYWSNSCCSHPRRGETTDEAAKRRLAEELGVEGDPEHVFTFQYHARYEDIGSERERCGVYLIATDDPVSVNDTEVAATRWMSAEELDRELATRPDAYTPWLKLEWGRLRSEFGDVLRSYVSSA